MSESKKIKVESSDSQEFTVDKDVVCMSETLKNMLSDLASTSVDTLPIPNIKGPTLGKVIEYCEYHYQEWAAANASAEPKPKVEDYRTDNIVPWDKTFMEVPMGLLFDIILAANYLDIKSLLDLGCKTIANMVKGKAPEEIKEMFRIPGTKEPDAVDTPKKDEAAKE